MKPRIFIDGEAGTTGLQIHSQLSNRDDIELLELPRAERKDPQKRSQALNECDIAILCLPDDAARESVSLVKNPRVRILDASSAHRSTPGWVYGLPELTSGQAALIAEANRVTNPGCYPTGAIALLRPLTERGMVPRDYPVNVHAISGYSGSGRSLIEAYEDPNHPEPISAAFRGYGLSLKHKHVPEMQQQALLTYPPLFTPSYGKYRQGIVLYVPLHVRLLQAGISAKQIHDCLSEFYSDAKHINVIPVEQAAKVTQLDPEYLNGTNSLDIYVFANEEAGQILLAAVFDNLGKGASRAAIQNLNIMLNNVSQ
ncbi:N-acetyl-gamma-glutamyl-phosphate reductase [Serratia sp. DD3]|uniref:N-acetyl-gamma-glutamyl-phosphate reductase n=1 Tax=Serratia sp. DD3 TaxID=1410619 RepID=UPI0003C51E17|nr:N-acetyl-gamma-glutamyl-phosphate reductase [Serratia sp. DD3]KEY56989.1 N-acetyl-gamma-glutamyl-phosphate reductase [Serratia sp. DD3]